MDFRITSIEENNEEMTALNSWDFAINPQSGDVEIVDDNLQSKFSETEQQANMALALERSTVPLIENIGVSWTGYLLKEKTLLEIDSEIRQQLQTFLGDLSYTPLYTKDGDKLIVNLGRVSINPVGAQ